MDSDPVDDREIIPIIAHLSFWVPDWKSPGNSQTSTKGEKNYLQAEDGNLRSRNKKKAEIREDFSLLKTFVHKKNSTKPAPFFRCVSAGRPLDRPNTFRRGVLPISLPWSPPSGCCRRDRVSQTPCFYRPSWRGRFYSVFSLPRFKSSSINESRKTNQ